MLCEFEAVVDVPHQSSKVNIPYHEFTAMFSRESASFSKFAVLLIIIKELVDSICRDMLYDTCNTKKKNITPSDVRKHHEHIEPEGCKLSCQMFINSLSSCSSSDGLV